MVNSFNSMFRFFEIVGPMHIVSVYFRYSVFAMLSKYCAKIGAEFEKWVPSAGISNDMNLRVDDGEGYFSLMSLKRLNTSVDGFLLHSSNRANSNSAS